MSRSLKYGLLVIFVLLVIFSLKFFGNVNQQQPEVSPPITSEEEGVTDCDRWRQVCAKEGESRCGPCGCRSCCGDLISRDSKHPFRSSEGEVVCKENMKSYVCVDCGNDVCGKGEDWCICPEDCPKPNPVDLEEWSR